MANKPRIIKTAIACPHCEGAIELDTFKTKRRKFLIVFSAFDSTGPCPHCGKRVRVRLIILKSREKQPAAKPEPVPETPIKPVKLETEVQMIIRYIHEKYHTDLDNPGTAFIKDVMCKYNYEESKLMITYEGKTSQYNRTEHEDIIKWLGYPYL